MANQTARVSTDLFHPLFENFFAPPLNRQFGNLLRAPESDVVETESEIRVMIEMPGIGTDQIEIGLENNVLSVTGEKREELERGDEKSTWHVSERRYGKFARSFLLPRDVEQERIEANVENGVLTVRIPKSERARRRRIEVRSNDGRQSVETGRVGDGAER